MMICRRYGDGTPRVEDTFQECFVQVFNSFKKAKNINDLDRWIAKISINTNINHYYAHKKEPVAATEIEVLHEGHKEILEGLSADEILAAIAQMPGGFRVVFNMYFIDGYSHREIAERLKIAESASRSQLSRAKAHLKSKLEAMGIFRYEAS